MRKLSLYLSLAIVLIVGAAMVGCQKSGDAGTAAPPKASDTIKIGLAGTQTGSDGQIGLSMLNGSQIAIDEWNAKGGVLGKKIESIALDDEASGQKAVTVAQTLIDAGVVAVIGHFNSGCTIPASPLYNEAKIIEISPGSTNPQYTEQGFPYAFRICGRDDQQGAAIAAFLRDNRKLNKIAILDDKTTYGEGLAKVVKNSFEAKGGTVVVYQGIEKGDFDFRANITALQSEGAEALVWGGMYGGGGPLCVQLRQAGLTIPFVSDDGCQDQAFVNMVGDNAQNVFVSFGKDYTGQPAAQAFIQKYKETYHRDIGSYSVYGYDAAQVLLTAIQKAQTTDADKVAAVLKGQPFDTIQGQIEFDAKGDLKVADYVIWTVKDGKLQELPPAPVSSTLTEILIGGVSRGAMYALVALGYTMVYGVLGMINFAHGEIFMIGMFSCVYAIGIFSLAWGNQVLLNLTLGIAVAMIFSAAYGYANERIAYRRLRKAHVLAPLTSAIGISTFLQYFIFLTVSRDSVNFPRFYSDFLTNNHIFLGPVQVTYLQLMILGLTLVIMAGLFYLIHCTRIGIALRATAQDQLMASLVGIPVNRIIAFTFILGSALAAIAGVMFSMYNNVLVFDAGYRVGLKAFTAAILGGIGNVPGAVLGAMIIGLTEALTTLQFGSEWNDVTTFGMLMLVLLLRPRGILGERVADKV